jgi:hypothetical protein
MEPSPSSREQYWPYSSTISTTTNIVRPGAKLHMERRKKFVSKGYAFDAKYETRNFMNF